ncbi:MAG: hypothetical protein ACTHLR_09440, partial [Rhizomicrobium sp.]
TQELRTPAIKPLHDLVSASIDDQLQFDGFYDFAWLRDQKVAPGDKRSSVLASAGAGFQYGIGRYFIARLDYGWQLRTPGSGASKEGQIDVSVSLNN